MNKPFSYHKKGIILETRKVRESEQKFTNITNINYYKKEYCILGDKYIEGSIKSIKKYKSIMDSLYESLQDEIKYLEKYIGQAKEFCPESPEKETFIAEFNLKLSKIKKENEVLYQKVSRELQQKIDNYPYYAEMRIWDALVEIGENEWYGYKPEFAKSSKEKYEKKVIGKMQCPSCNHPTKYEKDDMTITEIEPGRLLYKCNSIHEQIEIEGIGKFRVTYVNNEPKPIFELTQSLHCKKCGEYGALYSITYYTHLIYCPTCGASDGPDPDLDPNKNPKLKATFETLYNALVKIFSAGKEIENIK